MVTLAENLNSLPPSMPQRRHYGNYEKRRRRMRSTSTTHGTATTFCSRSASTEIALIDDVFFYGGQTNEGRNGGVPTL